MAEGTQSQQSKPVAKVATDIYHVVGPGSVLRTVLVGTRKTRVNVGPGELIELTEEDARALGALVAKGEPPPPPTPPEQRKAGRYRVVGPGGIKAKDEDERDGASRFRRPGDVLRLTAESARSLGKSIIEA
jgi:hypothetical protein